MSFTELSMTDLQHQNLKLVQPKVSVVVAAYNVESYITNCLESLKNQTLQSIEVLIVNDGSTDRTEEICRQFVEVDSRFQLINQDSLGLGEARNRGIIEASGSYIAFVDGDDFVEPSMYKKLWQRAQQEQADLVLCGYKKVWPESIRKKYCVVNESIIKQENPVNYFLSKHDESLVVAWNKLFLRSHISENKLYFENRAFFEDVSFMARYLSVTKKITIVHEPLYCYVQRQRLTTKTYNPNIEQSHKQTLERLRKFFNVRSYRVAIEALNLRMCIYRYQYVLKTNYDKPQLKVLEQQIKGKRPFLFQLPVKHQLLYIGLLLKVYPNVFRLMHRVRS